ncbi:MAG: acyltransferase family protein [Terriglobales bacterium]
MPVGWLFASFVRMGRFGVNLFFLLSAYLITELLLREKEQFGAVHLKSFYVRRILRIWPLYFLGILIGVLLHLVDPDQAFPLKYVIAFLLLSGNWLISFAGFPPSVMGPLWSVSFEEQFYLIWPIIVSRARRIQTFFIFGGVLFLVGECGRMLMLKYGHRDAVFSMFTNTVVQLDALTLGALTAVLSREFRFRVTPWMRLAFLLGGLAFWVPAAYYQSLSRNFMLFGWPAAAMGAWLIFLSVFEIGVAPRWMRYLGKISYGLYVFHMLAIYIVAKALSRFPPPRHGFSIYWCSSLALTVAMSVLSYHFFEAPFLRLKERFAFVQSRPV